MVHRRANRAPAKEKGGGAEGLQLRNESDLVEDWQAGQEERQLVSAIGINPGYDGAWRWELRWRRWNSGAASNSENRSLNTGGADSPLFKSAASPKISAVNEAF